MRINLVKNGQKTHPMKGKTMLNKKSSAFAALACITTVGLALGISPAKAFDPVAQKFAIVGSDTLEDVVGALVNGTSVTDSGVKAVTSDSSTFGSFDATGTGTIFTKAYGTRFQRPNGSGDGRTALDALIIGANYTSTFSGRDKTYDNKPLADGDIDIVRASSGGTSNGDGRDNMQKFTFGRDAIALAYGSAVTPGSGGFISKANAALLYQCDATAKTTFNVSKVWIPQAGSGTRNDFIKALGVSETQDILANLDSESNLAVNGVSGALGLGCVHVGQEHDATGLGTQDIMPMSATRWIAMKNGVSYNKSGSASLGGFVAAGVSPTTGTAPNLTPTVAYYKDSTWGRDTYLFVDRRRTDSASVTIHPAATVTSGSTASFKVDATSGVYAGQQVVGTGVDAGTLVSSVSAYAAKKGTGTSGSTTLLTTALPAVDQILNAATPGTGLAADVRVTAAKSFNSVSRAFNGASGQNVLTFNTDAGTSNTGTSAAWSSDITVGQQVVGAGIPKNTYVTATNGSSTITLSNNTTAALSNTAVTLADNSRGVAASGSTALTIDTANAHILVGAVVSGTGITSGTVVTGITGTSVTLSAATTAAVTLTSGVISFTKNAVTLSSALLADLANATVNFEKTVTLSKATVAELTSSSNLVLTSPSYDAVLARALDFNYSGALTYQGGALFGIGSKSIATTASGASSTTTLTVASTTGVFVGQTVAGTGITSGTIVTAVNFATSVTLSAAANVADTAAITFANNARSAFSTTAAAASTAATLTVASASGVYVGQTVVGTGIASGTTVAAVSGTTVTLSANATVANSAALLFGYSYAQMSDTVYPVFLSGSIAAVKLKFGFLPASVQDAASYAGK